MHRLRQSKELFAIGVAAVVLVAGGAALGAELTSSETSVTGCLSPNGDLTRFAPGDSPLKPCAGNQVQVHLTGDDLASLVAGTGLTKSTANGGATLSIDPSYALPQGCAVDDTAVWNGNNWRCSSDVGPLPS